MKNLLCRAWQRLRAIPCCELEKKYELSLSLYPDSASQSADCQHTFSGSSRHALWKLVALWGGIALSITLIGSLCSLCRMGRK